LTNYGFLTRNANEGRRLLLTAHIEGPTPIRR
jgi:hypothetical protein